MNTINEQIQEPEIVAGVITDGSQVIAHDGFDVETFEQAADDYARLARTVEKTAGAIRTGQALLRDLFWSFHKRAPRIALVAPLSPAHEINREIIEQIYSTNWPAKSSDCSHTQKLSMNWRRSRRMRNGPIS